jgi:hypothetical protein
MAVPRFAPNNADLIGLFNRLEPSLLRIGGNSVDETQWVPNGDAVQNLALSVDTGRTVNTAALLVLTGPALSATPGVSIQGAAVTQTGAFASVAAYTPTVAAGVVTCYVPAASTALIQIT